jgi:hypothetical protein
VVVVVVVVWSGIDNRTIIVHARVYIAQPT